ncbi:MAG: T9SS type A sorting domain-containing protein, partial [Bacteroidota bacterium]
GSSPRTFLFHQGSDVIVNYDFGRLLSRISIECFAPTNFCQPVYNYPNAWGGEGIRRIFGNMGSQAPVIRSEIVYNYEYGNDCFDNGHSIDNTVLRFSQVLQFFSEGIDTTSNHPPNACSSSSVNTLVDEPLLNVAVSGGYLQLVWSGTPVRQQVVIFSSDGSKAAERYTESNSASFDVSGWAAGVYIVRLAGSGLSRKVVID